MTFYINTDTWHCLVTWHTRDMGRGNQI